MWDDKCIHRCINRKCCLLFSLSSPCKQPVCHYSCWSFHCCCPNALPETVIFPPAYPERQKYSFSEAIYFYFFLLGGTTFGHSWPVIEINLSSAWKKRGYSPVCGPRTCPIARYNKSPAGPTSSTIEPSETRSYNGCHRVAPGTILTGVGCL